MRQDHATTTPARTRRLAALIALLGVLLLLAGLFAPWIIRIDYFAHVGCPSSPQCPPPATDASSLWRAVTGIGAPPFTLSLGDLAARRARRGARPAPRAYPRPGGDRPWSLARASVADAPEARCIGWPRGDGHLPPCELRILLLLLLQSNAGISHPRRTLFTRWVVCAPWRALPGPRLLAAAEWTAAGPDH